MKRHIIAILTFLGILLPASAQIYKYFGVIDGLSDRRVLSIQKDSTGYMWFLTYTGIDRFDGKTFKHYRLQSEQGYVSFYSEKNILKTDSAGRIWTVSPHGSLYHYDYGNDKFKEVPLKNIVKNGTMELVEMTDNDEIWFCYPNHQYQYDIHRNRLEEIRTHHQHNHITSLYQSKDKTYFIGTEHGICHVYLKNDTLFATHTLDTKGQFCSPQTIYHHEKSNRLIVSNQTDGMMVYDLTLNTIEHIFPQLKDFTITTICEYDKHQVLIPTRGAGVYLYDFKTGILQPFFKAANNEPNKMNGNNIHTLHIDNDQRIWMSVYPNGVTVYDKNYPDYKWYRNHIGNNNSIKNDQVNYLIEDSEGDIWYATNNGISIFNPTTNEWKHLLTQDESDKGEIVLNHTFLSLCEIHPGTVIAGGYTTGVYRIDKKTLNAQLLTSMTYNPKSNPNFANKYIRVIFKDNEGLIWTGGNYYLGCTDEKKQTLRNYFIGNAVTCILQKDSATLYVGTGDGIYLLNKQTHSFKRMRLPFASQHINALYQHTNGDLYIATNNSGLVVLKANGKYKIFNQYICTLLSDIIISILPKDDKNLILTTNRNITLFDIENERFYNWTEDQGLPAVSFNPRASLRTSRATFIFGTGWGAIEFSDTITLPKHYRSQLMFDQILIEDPHTANYFPPEHRFHSTDNDVQKLSLAHNENSIALHVSSINYGNPQYTNLRYRLIGKSNYWITVNKSNWIQLKNLPTGDYTLQLQSFAQEDQQITHDTCLKISVSPSFWETGWGLILSIIICLIIIYILAKYVHDKQEKRRTRIRIRQFVDASYCQRTSLSLINASIHEVLLGEQTQLSPSSYNNLQIATYNTEILSQMANEVLSAEQHIPNKVVHVTQHSLNKHIEFYITLMKPLARRYQVELETSTTSDNELFVWFDSQKIEVILYSLLANLIAHTPATGTVKLLYKHDKHSWSIIITNYSNNSIQKRTNQDTVHHSDISQLNNELYFIRRLVQHHKGKLTYKNNGGNSYTFTVTIPKKHPNYQLHDIKENGQPQEQSRVSRWILPKLNLKPITNVPVRRLVKGHLLIAERNPEIQAFLNNALYSDWEITTAQSVYTALEIIREYEPDAIISGFGLSQAGEEDLCTLLKSNMSTSHIPIIMLTSDENKNRQISGYRLRADHYVSTPFDMRFIRAILSNIAENRKHTQEHANQSSLTHELKEMRQSNIELEEKFLHDIYNNIKQHILDKDFNVDTLCSLMGMSRTSLYSKVKALTNQAISDIIREIRLQKAGEMLLTGEHTIMEISDIMGFSEPKYFREVFKKHYGISPSEYIKKYTHTSS